MRVPSLYSSGWNVLEHRLGGLGVYVIVVLPPLIQLGQCLSCEVNVTSPNADVLTAEMVDEWLYST